MRPLSDKEMASLRGRGAYRNTYFNGSLPWQKSFHDVNLCNGNLFKSFTDVQVQAARGAGLLLQRTCNSNVERIGPFGVGWTHAYDIHIDEAIPGMVQTGNIGTACPTFNMTLTGNGVDRQDFFGGEHNYQRDADGLYTPPVYLHDQLTSNYLQLMANGPSEVSDDTQTDNSGTTKHFFKNGNERDCDWIQDRHGNTTTLQYNQPATMDDGTIRNLLTKVTDPSGRSLTFTWTNLGTTGQPAWRITEVDAPVDPTTSAPLYRVTYDYYTDPTSANADNELYNLKDVTLDPDNLDRVTTFTYTGVTGDQGSCNGLLASISDPLGHTVSYTYTLVGWEDNSSYPTLTGTAWVASILEPGGSRLNGPAPPAHMEHCLPLVGRPWVGFLHVHLLAGSGR